MHPHVQTNYNSQGVKTIGKTKKLFIDQCRHFKGLHPTAEQLHQHEACILALGALVSTPVHASDAPEETRRMVTNLSSIPNPRHDSLT